MTRRSQDQEALTYDDISLNSLGVHLFFGDIARAVAAGTADDLRAAFVMVGKSTKPIELVQRTISEVIEDAREQVIIAIISGTAADMDVKQMAQKYAKTPLFSQIMRAFRGQEIDWMEWYSKNCLEVDWGLEVIE